MRPKMTIGMPLATAAVVVIFVMLSACELLQESVPVMCTRRESRVGNGHVIKVENQSEKTLSLWIETSEKKKYFTLGPNESTEFGWLEGFHFGDNTTYTIGGEGYSSRTFSKDEG